MLLSISKKSLKIKVLDFFWKILFKFLCQKWGREAPGRPQGDPPCHLTTRGCGPSLAAPWHAEGAPWPSTYLYTLTSFSPLKYRHTSAQPCSCCSSSQFFDLLAQPIFAAEIWSNCSLVCDSFDCPSRILFSRDFLSILAL
jgi:hypothetical protein